MISKFLKEYLTALGVFIAGCAIFLAGVSVGLSAADKAVRAELQERGLIR